MPVGDAIDIWTAIKDIAKDARDEHQLVANAFGGMYEEACQMLSKFAGGTPQEQQTLTKTIITGAIATAVNGRDSSTTVQTKEDDILVKWNESIAAGHVTQT